MAIRYHMTEDGYKITWQDVRIGVARRLPDGKYEVEIDRRWRDVKQIVHSRAGVRAVIKQYDWRSIVGLVSGGSSRVHFIPKRPVLTKKRWSYA